MKDVVGYEDIFSITEDGNVFSKRTNKFLVQNTSSTGYKAISSRIGGRNGKCINLRVHRLVAEAFIPNPENKPFVNHIDGNKTNNSVENLEWVTALENTRHAWETGLVTMDVYIKNGENLSNLTEEEVRYVREVYVPFSKEFGCRALARKFNVEKSTIVRIVNNITWKHI